MIYFDLERELRGNPDFSRNLDQTFTEAARVYSMAKGNPRMAKHYFGLLASAYQACHHNPVLLSPIIFPQFPKDKPLSFRRYPFAFQMFSTMLEGYTVFRGSRQISKCRPLDADEPILGADYEPIYPKDLKVGSKVLSIDPQGNGVPDRVVAIHRIKAPQVIARVRTWDDHVGRWTLNHQLMTQSGWVAVGDLSVNTEIATLLDPTQGDCIVWTRVRSIETEDEDQPVWDIETEKHHNYILNGIVSHNSTSLSARQVLNASMMPGFTSTYICPRSQYLETYADRLRDIYSACRYFKEDHRFRNNLFYKEFPNRSRIRLLHVLSSAANARSKSTDELLFDEYQDFDPDLELEVMQTQSASESKITIYAGTSLTTNTALEEKFTQSSQGFWLSKCPNGHFNLPLPEHGIMDMIQPQGPSCAKCGCLMDMAAGYYEHAYPERIAAHRVGYHIPQIIVPAVYENPQRWREILTLKQKGDIRKFNQEVLGIPSEEGEREITRRHLQLMCTLGSDLNRLRQHAASGDKYEFLISSFDWGGSDYDPGRKIKASTTVHSVLGVKGDGGMDIVHIKRYQGMKYDEIVANFRANHNEFGVRFAASDFGVGHYYNDQIRKFMDPVRHFILHYADRTAGLIANIDSNVEGFNHWNLNRTDSLSQLYNAIRIQRIRCFAWELAEEFLTDMLNVYRVPHEGPGGVTRFTYVGHPARWTDVLHAINYGFQMGRLLLGEPVTNHNGLIDWATQQRNQPGDNGNAPDDGLSAFSG